MLIIYRRLGQRIVCRTTRGDDHVVDVVVSALRVPGIVTLTLTKPNEPDAPPATMELGWEQRGAFYVGPHMVTVGNFGQSSTGMRIGLTASRDVTILRSEIVGNEPRHHPHGPAVPRDEFSEGIV